ncbi:hypothetical protein AB0C07_26830 [Actinoplanes missouriensis]|uniref:hypothetical protein n=1 Tax=Actinoplanes missouriensis TaxID=1866 RepID=UPI0033D799A8
MRVRVSMCVPALLSNPMMSMSQSALLIRARAVRVLACAALVLMVSACSADPLPQPPAPPGAIGVEDIALDPMTSEENRRFGNAYIDLVPWLRENYEPPWELSTWYRLPPDTTWESIEEHYAAALGPDWTVDDRYQYPRHTLDGATDLSDRHARVWSNGDRAVAIMVNPGDPGSGPILHVLLPKEKRR